MAKESLKEKMLKRKKKLESKGGSSNITYIKEGTMRVRILPLEGEEEFAQEVVQFYLGAEIKGVFSQSTFGNECPLQDKYRELMESDDDDDKELAKSLKPKTKYLMPCIIYKDQKGKEIDKEKGITLVQVTPSLYNDLIDHWLDEDDWGDMTDPKDGYDIKLTRKGSGQFDTEYSMSPCPKTKIKDKAYHKPINLTKLIQGIVPSYETAEEKLNQFLGIDSSDDEPKKKKKKKSSAKEDKSSKKKKPVKKSVKTKKKKSKSEVAEDDLPF